MTLPHYAIGPDLHPRKADRFIGRACSFDGPNGARLVGVVESARYLGRTLRGDIPDYLLTIRGKSGATMEISLVRSHVSFPHPDFPL